MFEKLLTNLNFLLGLKIEGLFPTVFSPPLQGEVSRKPLAVYETEGLGKDYLNSTTTTNLNNNPSVT